MTPRAQELLDLIKARRAAGIGQIDYIGAKVRERTVVEKYDHEIAPEPVLVETVELILENGVLVSHRVTKHGDGDGSDLS